MLHPITFSIPGCKVLDTIPLKKKMVSNLIPGQKSTYIYSNETDYYNEYRQSLFAITTKKGGWDCMRHYEIMANGTIPFFSNIESCPPNTLALLPKDMLMEGNRLYSKYQSRSINDLSTDEMTECTNLITRLLDHTKKYLTTVQIAKYILEKSNHSEAKRILYLSKDPNPDYLRCVTLHGFKELYGSSCHDYPKIPHIYKSGSINYSALYGKGITYTNLLDSVNHDSVLNTTIAEDIRTKKYDIVIYGSYHRGMPFYDLVCGIYKPNEIILICGEDLHGCNHNHNIFVQKGHSVFVREL